MDKGTFLDTHFHTSSSFIQRKNRKPYARGLQSNFTLIALSKTNTTTFCLTDELLVHVDFTSTVDLYVHFLGQTLEPLVLVT